MTVKSPAEVKMQYFSVPFPTLCGTAVGPHIRDFSPNLRLVQLFGCGSPCLAAAANQIMCPRIRNLDYIRTHNSVGIRRSAGGIWCE